MAAIAEILAAALAHHQAAQFQQAEQLYRQVLATEPLQPDALHLLGVLSHQVGRHEAAVELIRRAVEILGTEPDFHFNLGEAYRALGRPAEAGACYQQALELRPDFVEALNNLGIAWQCQGQWTEAACCLRRAIELRPDYAPAHNNLGIALQAQGELAAAITSYRRALQLQPNFAEALYHLGCILFQREELDEAAACFQRALTLKPDFSEAHYHLGCTRFKQGHPDSALACYEQALRLRPDYAEAHNNRGVALHAQGHLAEAAVSYRRALERKPEDAQIHFNLGYALHKQGELAAALACYERALQLRPDFAEVYNNQAGVFEAQGQLAEAIGCYQRAVQLKPDDPDMRNNLGAALHKQGRLDEAMACYRENLHVQPDHAPTYNNLGSCLKDQGQLEEALRHYRRALELKPGFAEAHSNLVYALHFCCEDGAVLSEEHRRWYEQHAEPLAACVQPHANGRAPGRRLRIGYVSPDFRSHPVGRFLLPLLEQHDHDQFEIVCYSSLDTPDAITERCRARADLWRPVVGVSDEQLAHTIREDGIDILVDLSMHMAGNRLLVFARKPAPVQVTYLAYCGTTGLRAIDYRLTDPYLDPPDRQTPWYTEESVWLPQTYWCYAPPDVAPSAPSPAVHPGAVTFGCLNNFCKVTAPVLDAWARLLQALPQAHLLIHAQEGSHRARVRDEFARQGIAPARLSFVERVRAAQYFRTYAGLDIALDPFPYGGGTTTCDALWMGVPVVSLAGRTAVGRGGLSILSNVGLPDLVAKDVEEYVRLAVDLAHDLPRLRQLRATLRERMRASPLMDAPRFARNVEAAYRTVWRRWCAA